MQTTANSNLVLTDFSSLKRFADLKTAISYGGFYQQVASELVKGIHTRQFLSDMGEKLVDFVEHAHAFRQVKALSEMSKVLLDAPVPRPYKAVGQYYQALCTQGFGRGDLDHAARLLEPMAEYAPPTYRIRAMQSLGTNSLHKGDHRTALSLYAEAGRFASCNKIYDSYATLGTQKMFAVVKSEDGNHVGALVILENLLPLAHRMRTWRPHVYNDFLNSLAVELCEVGRLEEARNISQIVLASPFAPAYPEWRETTNEIVLRGRLASRSVVASYQWTSESESQTTSEAGNLVQLAAPQRSGSTSPQDSVATRTKQRARVVTLVEWKNEMAERKSIPQDRQTRLKELKRLPTEDKIAKIWGRLGDEEVNDDLLCEALLILEDYQPEENQGA
jgi:hypothetical protein